MHSTDKVMLAAVAMTGFFTFTTIKAVAAPVVHIQTAPALSLTADVDYRWGHRHWQHRNWHHGHWHYWN
jgi:hypothetical protein